MFNRMISYRKNQVTRGISPQISSSIVHVYMLLTAFELYSFDMANLKECVQNMMIVPQKKHKPKIKAFEITSNFYQPKSKPLLYAQTEMYSYIFTG